ncbi:MAG TPA: sulfite exporter TauE/SafE family protein [Cellvibrio sp.]|nr:sulfite exporter TauE/SafE family protein [Cellvibrio sp.]
MTDWALLSSMSILLPMFIMGLVSSAHCIGMCGGIMGALTMAIPAEASGKRWGILLAYNLGRIVSYSVMGFLVGLFAQQLIDLGGASLLRILAGVLLIAMGLYLADWWRGLVYLEKIGRYLWVYVQPLGKPLVPVNSFSKALLLGALWGWLPCGLVYSALALAMTQTPGLASGSMLAFGLGTLPAVLAAGIAAQQLTRLLQQRGVRAGLALLIIIYGLWTVYGAVGGQHQHQHQQLPAETGEQPDHSGMHHHH